MVQREGDWEEKLSMGQRQKAIVDIPMEVGPLAMAQF